MVSLLPPHALFDIEYRSAHFYILDLFF
jgi:hypothetical protein